MKGLFYIVILQNKAYCSAFDLSVDTKYTGSIYLVPFLHSFKMENPKSL